MREIRNFECFLGLFLFPFPSLPFPALPFPSLHLELWQGCLLLQGRLDKKPFFFFLVEHRELMIQFWIYWFPVSIVHLSDDIKYTIGCLSTTDKMS